METTPALALMRTLSSAASRRGLLAILSGGLLATGLANLREDDAEARKNGKRNKKRKNRNKNKNKRNNAKTRLDATCPGEAETGVRHPVGEARLAQTFTANRSGALVKVTLPLTNESGAAGDVELRLSPVDSSGLPTNEALAETRTALDTAPDEIIELEFVFADPFTVQAGVDYALVLSRTDGDEFIWHGDQESPCGGIVAFSLDQTSPFQDFGVDVNLGLTTFVRT